MAFLSYTKTSRLAFVSNFCLFYWICLLLNAFHLFPSFINLSGNFLWKSALKILNASTLPHKYLNQFRCSIFRFRPQNSWTFFFSFHSAPTTRNVLIFNCFGCDWGQRSAWIFAFLRAKRGQKINWERNSKLPNRIFHNGIRLYCKSHVLLMQFTVCYHQSEYHYKNLFNNSADQKYNEIILIGNSSVILEVFKYYKIKPLINCKTSTKNYDLSTISKIPLFKLLRKLNKF